MRIATTTLSKTLSSSMGGSYNNYVNLLNKIAGGKNFTKVSENPTDATKVLKLKDEIAKINEYQSNIKAATTEMDLAYDTLGEIVDELSNINASIAAAATGTTTPDDAKAYGDEIKEKVATIKDKINIKYLDNYIFSGTYTNVKPYSDNVGTTTYQGSIDSASDRNITIGENKTFTYNLSGDKIFELNNNNNFFNEMEDLDNLLRQEPLDHDKIREKLGVLEEVTKNISQAQGSISAKVIKLTALGDSNTNELTKLTQDRVDLEEVDIIKAASDLMSAQQALQASYLVGSQIMSSVSLLDYL